MTPFIRVGAKGMSLLEVLFVTALAATLVGMAVPVTSTALDRIRTAAAARHVASAIATARIAAVKESTANALQFEADGDDYTFTPHADGNGNGVRTVDIRNGVDPQSGRQVRLRQDFPGVVFGLLAGIPDLDGGQGNPDGVRIGNARILTLAPNGSATSGTLYVHGRRAQYAIRVLGATGRVRVFEYDPGARRWNAK